MAKQVIGIGAAPNDGTGDALRTAFGKVNDNFTELYAAWRFITSWTFSTNVTEVAFTSLGSYAEIMVLIRNVTLGTSGTRNIQTSANGGSSYFTASGDYKSVSTAGAEASITSIPGHVTSSTAARTAQLIIHDWNTTRAKAVETIANTTPLHIIDQGSAMDALKVLPSGGGNMTGGSIFVFGR